MWTCIACGRTEKGTREPPACLCGVEGSWTLEGRGGARAARAVRADAVRALQVKRVATGTTELDAVLGGGWPLGSQVSLTGDPGAGKSRLAFRWVRFAAPTLVIALEMPLELTSKTIDEAGGDRSSSFLLDTAESWRSEAERLGARSVIVDSGSSLPRGQALELARELYQWAHDTNGLVFFIVHQNRRGRARGMPEAEYFADVNVRVRKSGPSSAKVIVKKSRYCATGSAPVSLVGPGA